MKNKILYWTSVLLASSALILSGCKSEDDSVDTSITPAFPELLQATIPAGENSCAVTFTPNMDWSASIPTDEVTSRWFTLRYDPFEGVSVSGKASTEPVTLYVESISTGTFDENPVCEVSLTMNGQTKVIAQITRGNKAREFELYASEYNTTDDSTKDDFTIPYVYPETALKKYSGPDQDSGDIVELKWPFRVSSFMYVFKAKGNFNWLISKPEGLEISSMAIADDPGSYQITVTGDFSATNLDTHTAVIDFYDKSINRDEDPGNNAHNRYCLRIPGFRDIVRHPLANTNATFTFNNEGKYISNSLGNETISENLSTTVSSTEGLAFYVAEETEYGYVFKQGPAQWVTIADTWNSELEDVFQEHQYTVTVAPNETGAARTAKLIALPKSLADELQNDDPFNMLENSMTDFKAEYKPYVYATIEQSGPDTGGSDSNVISISVSADVSAFDNQTATFKSVDDSYFSQHPNASLEEVKAAYEDGIPVYELTYNDNSPASNYNAVLDINIEMGGDDVISSSESTAWLSTMIISPNLVVDMGANEANKGDIGYIAFKKNDKIFAYLICVRNF